MQSKWVLIAAVTVAIVLLARLLWHAFALKIMRAATRTVFADVGKRAVERVPDTIHLMASTAQWRDPEITSNMCQPLLDAGFKPAGTFTLERMPTLLLAIFVDEQHSMAAQVHEFLGRGTWVEFVTRYQDGTVFTFTTHQGTGLKSPSFSTVVRSPQAPMRELILRALAERKTAPMKQLSAGSAAQDFEEGYARGMAARKKQGISADEVAKVAQRRRTLS